MTTKKCNDCGYNQDIRTDDRRKQHSKWRCTDCGAVHKLHVIAVIALFTLAIGFSYAYAEQQATVTLPLERPYADMYCNKLLAQEINEFRFLCVWKWTVSQEGMDEIPYTTERLTGEDYQIWIEEILPIVENNPFRESEPMIDLFPQPPVKSVEEEQMERLDPEVRKAIEKLGECQFGREGWASFQAQINFTVPVELPIFTSGLDKDRIINELARNFEACRGQDEYPLSDQWHNVWLADQFGIKQAEERIGGGEDTRRLMEEQRTASPEEIKAEADRVTYPDWYVNPYEELTGINRGNPEPIVDEKLYNEYLTAQAARDLTAADRERVLNNAILLMCEIYTQQYAHLIRTDVLGNLNYEGYPDWLMQCHD